MCVPITTQQVKYQKPVRCLTKDMNADEHVEADVALVLGQHVLPAVSFGRVILRGNSNGVALLARAGQPTVAHQAAAA